MATKKVLIVVSHPDAVNSFNQKMVKVAQEALKKKGFEVRVNNLVASQFSPYAGKPDFKELKNKDKFDYQLEQKVALEKGTFIDEIKKQQDDLVWCDYVIHQFPFYWFSIPGLHKAWVDRVLSYHFAYGQDHAHLKGKKWLTAVTTGGPEAMYTKDGAWGGTVEELLKHFNQITPKFCQMESLPIFVAHGVNFSKDEAKEQFLKDYEAHLVKHVV